MFRNLLKKVKSNAGNSLAEFAVVTAMMGTLASTAAPKFGGVGDGAKAKQTIATLDKIKTAANNFYNAKVSEEGRGRFPGQSKYDSKVGGFDLPDSTLTDAALETYLETILKDQTHYEATLDDYVYVFSTSLTDEDALAGDWMSINPTDNSHQIDAGFDVDGANDMKTSFGNQGISSPFQDGAYIYLVIPGSGSGSSAQAPCMIIADAENPSELHKVLTP
jgi:type II secretory pathway pseudopilin PulG